MTASITTTHPRCTHVHLVHGRCVLAHPGHDVAELGSIRALHVYSTPTCPKCGAPVRSTDDHYVPAIYHDTPPEDFGLYQPRWTCQVAP